MASLTNTENVLQLINRKFVTLQSEEVTYNNKLLKDTISTIIEIMKTKDDLFKTLYQNIYYGGSYFDDLKVGKPDEYDLDLLLVLPKECEAHKSNTCGCIEVIPSNKPGFFWFKLKENYMKAFNRFIREGYVQTDLMLSWLQSLIIKSLNTIPTVNYSFTTPRYNSQSGPALTLRLYGDFGAVDIDLVPAFKLGAKQWPKMKYRPNPSTTKTDFFIVPKKARNIAKAERYWRASFQDQEKELINQNERLKPALRLLKKLRTNLGHVSVSSYALKTIALWEVDSVDWNRNKSLSSVFVDLLEKYRDSLQNEKIPYYWNKRVNLFEGIHSDTLKNHCNEITRKINIYKRDCDRNPLEIAKIILKEGSEEYSLFLKYVNDSLNVSPLQPELTSADGLGSLEWQFQSRSDSTDERPSSSFQDQQQISSFNSTGWLIAGGAALAAAALVGLTFSKKE